MKVRRTKKGYTLSEIDGDQLDVAICVLKKVRDRYFRGEPDEDGIYFSSGSLAFIGTKKDLDDFRAFVDGFWEALN